MYLKEIFLYVFYLERVAIFIRKLYRNKSVRDAFRIVFYFTISCIRYVSYRNGSVDVISYKDFWKTFENKILTKTIFIIFREWVPLKALVLFLNWRLKFNDQYFSVYSSMHNFLI